MVRRLGGGAGAGNVSLAGVDDTAANSRPANNTVNNTVNNTTMLNQTTVVAKVLDQNAADGYGFQECKDLFENAVTEAGRIQALQKVDLL